MCPPSSNRSRSKNTFSEHTGMEETLFHIHVDCSLQVGHGIVHEASIHAPLAFGSRRSITGHSSHPSQYHRSWLSSRCAAPQLFPRPSEGGRHGWTVVQSAPPQPCSSVCPPCFLIVSGPHHGAFCAAAGGRLGAGGACEEYTLPALWALV